MSKPKRQLQKEIVRAITHGKEPERKLPDTLALTRSQALSLVALSNDEQRLRKQAQELNAALEATVNARIEVLTEIAAAHNITLEAVGASYQFDGNMMVNAAALPKAG